MEKPYVIGVDLGGTNTVFGVVDARGNVVVNASIKTATHTDTTDLFLPADLLDEHVEACDEVIQVELNIVVRSSLDRGVCSCR